MCEKQLKITATLEKLVLYSIALCLLLGVCQSVQQNRFHIQNKMAESLPIIQLEPST